MPPGQWAGRQAVALGLVGSPTEEQTERLFGRCTDPSTGEPLGRRMAEFRSVGERVADRLVGLGRTSTDDERAAIDAQERAKGQPQAVTASDLTLSALKSVSILWALGGDRVRDTIQAAPEAAWRDGGVTVAAFEHWLNRAGPAAPHASGRLRHGPNDSVGTVAKTGLPGDVPGRRVGRGALATPASCSPALATSGGSGSVTARGRGDRALHELRGISDDLVEAFSSRAAQVDATLAHLVGDFADAPGYAPDRATTARLARQVVLMERPASEQRSWADQREHWLVRAAGVLGVTADQVGRTVVAAAVGVGGLLPADVERSELWAVEVLARLEERGAAWSRREIGWEAAAMLREAGIRVDDASVKTLVAEVEAHADSVSLAVADVGAPVPDVMRQADGTSVFARRGEQLLTSRAILHAERETGRDGWHPLASGCGDDPSVCGGLVRARGRRGDAACRCGRRPDRSSRRGDRSRRDRHAGGARCGRRGEGCGRPGSGPIRQRPLPSGPSWPPMRSRRHGSPRLTRPWRFAGCEAPARRSGAAWRTRLGRCVTPILLSTAFVVA